METAGTDEGLGDGSSGGDQKRIGGSNCGLENPVRPKPADGNN